MLHGALISEDSTLIIKIILFPIDGLICPLLRQLVFHPIFT
jgi:hypothetical protein